MRICGSGRTGVPLRPIRPAVVFQSASFKAEVAEDSLPRLYVGLPDQMHYLFPADFQADFDHQTYAAPTMLFRQSLQANQMALNGEPVNFFDITGFSPRAEKGILDEKELDQELIRYFGREKGIFVGRTRQAVTVSFEQIQKYLEQSFAALNSLGLKQEHDWGLQLPTSAYECFPFPLTTQITMALFNTAYSLIRLKQLVRLMEMAYRGNSPKRIGRLNRLFTIDQKTRLNYFGPAMGTNELARFERQDLALKIALLKEYALLRGNQKAANTDAVAWGLFLYGDAYRQTSQFFRDTGVSSLCRLVDYIDFWHEIEGIMFALTQAKILPASPVAEQAVRSKKVLSYQGAQVIRAFTQISGRQVDLYSLPTPFNLYQQIFAH